MTKKTLKFLLKFAVSVGFVAWIVFTVNWHEVWTFLKKVELWQVGIYVLLYMAGIFISSYKWKFLANIKGFNLPPGGFFKLYFTGTFINNFMPSFIGGDAFKAYQIGKEGKKYPRALSTIVIDRATGFWGAMILTLFFAVLNFNAIFTNPILASINLAILVVLIISLIAFRFKKALFRSRFSKYLPGRILDFYKEFGEYGNNSGIITKSIGYSFLFSLIGIAAANYALFLALGIKIGVLNYLSVVFLISIISSIPVSINNIGIK
ncbi:MAG TPA: flippase-like domain-containing protein, partial [Candidatus Moranbacteria bacterium]|nr:flippase-like domain-containing protein [Candidatus Moranbacteria bacterium]